MRVVPRRTVVSDIDRRFDNLSGSHHQSHVNCVSSAYGIYVSGQLSYDVVGLNHYFINICSSIYESLHNIIYIFTSLILVWGR